MTYEDETEGLIPLVPWISDAERMRLMQADIDALKCERASPTEKLEKCELERDHWKQEFRVLNSCERGLLSEKIAHDALISEMDEVLEALRPFADVADRDIGEDESDNDRFRPMFALNAAPPLLVGDLRRASTLLSRYGR